MQRLTRETLAEKKAQEEKRLTDTSTKKLLICGGTGCHATGSLALKETLENELAAKGLQEKVQVVETGCNGFCAMGPLMVIQPEGVFYQKIKRDGKDIYVTVDAPVGAKVKTIPEYAVEVEHKGQHYFRFGQIFYKKQGDAFIVVKNPGL